MLSCVALLSFKKKSLMHNTYKGLVTLFKNKKIYYLSNLKFILIQWPIVCQNMEFSEYIIVKLTKAQTWIM